MCCCLLLAACSAASPIVVPAGIDHAAWTNLLTRHVDEDGLVAYDTWRHSATDRAALDAYLKAYAAPPTTAASGSERHAALLNLYNALTIAMVLELAPERSLWDHRPFKQQIHRVGGHLISLDDIEHTAARPEIGYRAHAALVCAARSCPPLARYAFTANRLDQQLDERMTVWLSRHDLNHFDPAADRAELSKIFAWFSDDFSASGGLHAVLARHHADPQISAWLADGSAIIDFASYDKALNRQER
ncbi:MAG: DUF547 domain-containing protein [Planctomycetota bacterium]|jgi:hypothetical protein